jgi:HSP20 family protein
MTMVRWDPWRELARMRGDLDELFTRSFGRTAREWLPAADVTRDGDMIVVQMDLPGMTADDVKIELHDQVLTISGERRQEVEGVLSRERVFGSFVRSFALPGGRIDSDDVTAEFANGELAVHIRLPAEPEAKEIEIRTAAPAGA